ncbi:DnaJ domain-containing protein [Azorhizobium doebereinerae]|uniref:DnaJ domain-containing protein n=1 Tax=Azorhizobium doebereinerae TaxID=281091 RepID=UPI000417561A|nr:DnaJ domain-containing protein [Azorhizobium doebereinerae]
MVSLLAGLALLGVGLYVLKLWTGMDAKALSLFVMRTGAWLALTGAVGALVTGRIGAAIPLAVVGLALLGRVSPGGNWKAMLGGMFGGLFGGARAPRVSRVRSAMLEMELDHGSGLLSGKIIAGPRAGMALDALDLPDLLALRAGLDPQSLSLIEAYLDRRAPAWREHVQGDAGHGDMGGGRGRAADTAMTEEEAYQVLGLEPGADETAVRAAHRNLMKKLHPDQGGSGYLASRVNQAKDVILRRHR